MFKRYKEADTAQVFGIQKTNSEYDDYVNGQNFVAKYPGQHSLEYDFKIILDKLDKDSYILDIGCRGGETVKKLQDLGYKNSFGTDIGDEAEKKCLENFGREWTDKYFKIGDIQNGIGFPHKFDFIIFSHTLEHCKKPVVAMRNIFHSLNEDGFLFIAIPSDWEDAQLQGHSPEDMMFKDPTTFFHWIFWESLEDITDFCESCGFEPIQTKDDKEKHHEHLLWLQKGEMDLMTPDVNFYDKPYLHWTMEDMFDNQFYDGLKNDFPKVDDFDLDDEVMNGRYIIAPDNPNFNKIIKNSTYWNTFYNCFNSEEFVMGTLNSLSPQLKESGCLLDFSKINFLQDSTIEPTNPTLEDLYVYVDFNIAQKGYKREIHTDMNNRVLGFLFYLTDMDKVSGDGGELGIYQVDGMGNPILSKLIQPKQNLGVWKLDAHDCWHDVQEMKNTDGWRKFVYVAITSKKVGVWKHKHAQWPNQEQFDIFKTMKF